MATSLTGETVLEQPSVPEKAASLFQLIREDIGCVFQRDPAARTNFEIITTYPGVHAVLLYRLANRLWCRGWRYLPRLISYLARIWTSIDIHPGATIGQRFFIDHGDGVVVGETAELGDDVTLYHGVTLGGVSWNRGKRHPTLGDSVVVGAGAKILGPISIGSRARVGANSVVISPVPDGKTVVGIPARVVRSSGVASESLAGIDLNHHLIPDPVADVIACLSERIHRLEQHADVDAAFAADCKVGKDGCEHCDASPVCEPLIIDTEKN